MGSVSSPRRVRLLEAERRVELGLHALDKRGKAALEAAAPDVGERRRPVADRQLRAVAADQIGRRDRCDQRPGALRLAERAERLAAEVPSAAASGRWRWGRAARLSAGSAPRKFGVSGRDLAADDRVVQRDVVAAEGASPR